MIVVVKKVSEDYVKNVEKMHETYKNARVFDVTAKGGLHYLSPDCGWGGIEVSVLGKKVAGISIKGIWDGLKVFKSDKKVSMNYVTNFNYLGKERGCKSKGCPVGMRWEDKVLDMAESENLLKEMYVNEVNKRFGNVIGSLKKMSKNEVVVLLDNEERMVPFSHVEVLKSMIES